ncbi:hypothetical protein COLO4_23480 [Corchorus olitorius]|uniref:Uncharacterized protein n=1 Tax=Corchorus olitorius TaxID=93759 RepID=A0A1R3IGA0_9ROSI|nr:hypothetical protein COLO4_23480 [Corchorus olitorius]
MEAIAGTNLGKKQPYQNLIQQINMEIVHSAS